MAREFKDKAAPAELGDPATDAPLTMRRHPDDDPMDAGARRAIKVDDHARWPWIVLTGREPGDWLREAEVADWPYTNMLVASAAFEPVDVHRTRTWDWEAQQVICRCGESAPASTSYEAAEWWRAHKRAPGVTAQAAERGDMDVTSFKGGAPASSS